MYGIKKPTIKEKILILVAEIIYLIIAYYLLFITYDKSGISLGFFIALIITALRLTAMMFIWLPRGIAWQEAIMNSIAFGIYYLGFPILMITSNQDANLTVLIVGWILFLGGSMLNTISELLRKPFKDNPVNQGKLYTDGLFKYAIHINYLGDCLWVLGLALISNNIYSLLIPLGLFLVFVFGYIPKSDDYLQNKYGEQFTLYKQTTKKLVPFIW
ncbi:MULTISPECIES: methyltransferase family protein [unclassified Lysinibacillus]|uniref:methyltransferase family protein n=1 Tax=unclassified Lysinibacillus TaxID=2636778 RepID=UPI0037F82BC0